MKTPMPQLLRLASFLSLPAFAAGSSTPPTDPPGVLAQVLMGIVAGGLVLGVIAAFVLLVGMAAQAVVLGRPTLPAKPDTKTTA